MVPISMEIDYELWEGLKFNMSLLGLGTNPLELSILSNLISLQCCSHVLDFLIFLRVRR